VSQRLSIFLSKNGGRSERSERRETPSTTVGTRK
jgi:hypothetical protein